MKISLQDSPFGKIDAQSALIFVVDKDFSHIKDVDSSLFSSLGFDGKDSDILFLPEQKCLYYALSKLDADSLREASAKAIRIVKKYPFKSLKVLAPSRDSRLLDALIAGFLLGDYTFDTYKNKKSESKLEKILIAKETSNRSQIEPKSFKTILARQSSISKAVNFTRELVNTPPDDATPKKLAKIAEKIAKEQNLTCKIHDEKYLEKEGMGAFIAVSRASNHPPRLIHLSNKPKNPKLRIALIGKGLTYDSGGLSLKPADFMVTMKADKGGGCAVLGILQAASELGIEIELHGIIGATENMIGGNAYKPDDILRAKNGKTIEVRNTDAEGRLVLADCLCYAQELKPDYIIDLATLTGACVVGLGEYTSGVLGHNRALKQRFLECANKSGELVADLPFNRHLKELIKSKVADVCNVSGTRYGGSITAGLFLSEFIEESYHDKWLHLDIAGPAYVEKEWDVNPHGASGAGVRMVIEFLESLAQEA
ncbi:MAG: leucyl aminopeptidase [Wolinella sp.]